MSLGPCGLSELPYGTYVYHGMGEHCKTKVLGVLLKNGNFKDSVEWHECANITPHPMGWRLYHKAVVRDGMLK